MGLSSLLWLLRTFLSTPSARRATRRRHPKGTDFSFLSTPSARRATRDKEDTLCTISNFYPRPPRGGRPDCVSLAAIIQDFYPRPPRGGRLDRLHKAINNMTISIHALREEGDSKTRKKMGGQIIFLSTPSARRATVLAPSGGSKNIFLSTPSARRATLLFRLLSQLVFAFLSTPSARRATDVRRPQADRLKFLSTPSARRATSCVRKAHPAGGYFYPRPPRGGRLCENHNCQRWKAISIHALREEGDLYIAFFTMLFPYFYPRPPRGGRLGHIVGGSTL